MLKGLRYETCGGCSYCGRVISIALSACMVSSFVPVGAFAEVRDIAGDQVPDLQSEPISNMAQTDSSDAAVASDASGAVSDSLVADQFTYQINNDGACSIVGYQGDATALDIPSTLNGITVSSVAAGAFKNKGLEAVTVPENVTSIGEGAFDGCNLLQVFLPSWDAYDVFAASESGYSCGEDTLYFVSPKGDSRSFGPGDDTGFGIAAKKQIDVKSAWCEITLPSGETVRAEMIKNDRGQWRLIVDASWVGNGNCEVNGFVYSDASGNETTILTTGFFGAYDFTWSDNGDGTCTVTGALGRSAELAVPAELGGLKVSAIGEGAFNGASWIESLSLPEGLRSIGKSAFKDCASLKSADLPEGLSCLGLWAFEGCASLESARVPGSVGSIDAAFNGCTSLGSVELGEGLESLQGMDFYGCASLESVKLPSTLRSIGMYSFSGCSSLASVELPASVDVGTGAFQGLAEGSVLRVPTWELFYKLDRNSTYLDPDRTAVAYSGPTTVYGTSLTLEGEIGVNLYVALPDSILNLNGAYAMVGMPGQAEKISLADAKKATAMPDLEGVPMYVFTTNVYAKNMADQLKFAVYDGDGNQLPLVNRKGAAISDNAFVYSVKSYYEAAQKAEGSTGSSALTNLAKMMVNYGAAAQIFFGYQTDALSGNHASKEATAVTSSDFEPYRGSISGSVTGLDVAGYTLTLEETTTLSYYFSPQLGHTIDEYVIKVDGVETTPVWSGQRWKATVSNIPAQNLDDFHTVTATSKKTGQMATVHACALSYASSVLRSKPNSNLEALCQALYLYNQAANAFFDSSKS